MGGGRGESSRIIRSQRHPRAQRHDSAQGVRAAQSGVEGHSTALREAGDDDASRFDAFVDLLLHNLVHSGSGFVETFLVFAVTAR